MNRRGVDMRVSVTISDDVNKLINEHAKAIGISKDKFISSIIDQWLDGGLDRQHNERGAGRKQVFGETHKVAMKFYKGQGMSYREIAKMYDCSVGTVCKLINEQ